MWSSAFQIAYVIYDYCSVLSLNIFLKVLYVHAFGALLA